MKHIILASSLLCALMADINASDSGCNNTPMGIELAKILKHKDVDKATHLLEEFKRDVKSYLSNCSNSKEKFEETSVLILTYEDRLSDLKDDLKNHTTKKIDCAKVPNSKVIDEAFKNAKAPNITTLYESYKKNSEAYLDSCTSHEDYEMVYEEALLQEEAYAAWKEV